MRIKFELCGLLAALTIFCNSASSLVESNASAEALSAPAPIGTALVVPAEPALTEAPPLKPSLTDDEGPSENPVIPKAPTRLERARAALAESDAPAISNHEICATLVEVAQANRLPVGFFTNLIWRESKFDHVAISRAGAMGIAQFMPDVAGKLGFDAFDARDALPASGKLLRTLRIRFVNLGLVAAAYNAGPKRVADWLESRGDLPKETRDYVSHVTGRPVEHWRALKETTVVYQVPRQVPCHRSAAFVAIAQAERAEQARKLAEEQKRLEQQKRETARAHRKKPPSRMVASRSRSS
jgi:Transglycosylase SLT domain